MQNNSEEARFTITLHNSQPIELLDLTNSFLGLADEYKRHVAKEGDIPYPDEVKLFVKNIKSGSIIADLIAIAPGVFTCISYAVTLTSFCNYLKLAFDYLLGKSKDNPGLDKANYNNLINVTEPIAKDQASQLNCETFVNNGLMLSISLNSIEANAAQNRARKEIEKQKEILTGKHENVVLYWYQARGDLKSQAGDRAIIESIWRNPVKTIFGSENLKKSMILGENNPFGIAYLVDVLVETVNSKPTIYNIIDFHQKIDKPD